MKRYVLGLVLFFAGWSLSRLPVLECLKAWAVAAPVPGDVNADGALDITDPLHLLSFLFLEGPPPASCSAAPIPVSAVFLLRHAEKASTPPDDPCLTAAGTERAKRLAEVFKNAKVDRLIASTLCRTKETLDPLAQALSLPISARIGDEAEVEASATGVVNLVQGFPAGTVSVVAHHSTTIRPILKKLGVAAAEADQVLVSVHDNLLLVLLPAGGTPQLIKLRY